MRTFSFLKGLKVERISLEKLSWRRTMLGEAHVYLRDQRHGPMDMGKSNSIWSRWTEAASDMEEFTDFHPSWVSTIVLVQAPAQHALSKLAAFLGICRAIESTFRDHWVGGLLSTRGQTDQPNLLSLSDPEIISAVPENSGNIEGECPRHRFSALFITDLQGNI